jgi:hypothetical protein
VFLYVETSHSTDKDGGRDGTGIVLDIVLMRQLTFHRKGGFGYVRDIDGAKTDTKNSSISQSTLRKLVPLEETHREALFVNPVKGHSDCSSGQSIAAKLAASTNGSLINETQNCPLSMMFWAVSFLPVGGFPPEMEIIREGGSAETWLNQLMGASCDRGRGAGVRVRDRSIGNREL